jgi:hypothetical protein
MNVNFDKKCIFLCHPKTGEKDIAEYFGKVGFHYQISENSEPKPLYRNWFSYKTFFSWIYDDFNLIVSIDNPYRRLVNDYKDRLAKNNNNIFFNLLLQVSKKENLKTFLSKIARINFVYFACW